MVDIEYGKAYQYDEVKSLVREKQLSILDTVVSICREQNLPYWLDGGTLLGAIRHKGFIPWDDDIDIGLMRKDYEILIQLLKQDLPQDLILQDHEADQNYRLPFVKIRDRFSKIEDSFLYNGIFIDIFPFDPMPDNRVLKLIQKNLFRVYEAMFVHTDLKALNITNKNDLKSRILKVGMRIASTAGNLLGHRGGKLFYNFILSISKINQGDQIGDGLTASWAYDKSIRSYDVYLPTKEAVFEGKYYSIPNNPDSYLRSLYGNDYMTPIQSNDMHIQKVIFLELPKREKV